MSSLLDLRALVEPWNPFLRQGSFSLLTRKSGARAWQVFFPKPCQTCLCTGAAFIKMLQGRAKPDGTPIIASRCSRLTEEAEVKRTMN